MGSRVTISVQNGIGFINRFCGNLTLRKKMHAAATKRYGPRLREITGGEKRPLAWLGAMEGDRGLSQPVVVKPTALFERQQSPIPPHLTRARSVFHSSPCAVLLKRRRLRENL